MANTSESPETIEFINQNLAALEAGNYSLTIQQQVQNTDSSRGSELDETFSRTYDFAVLAPRFTLPASDVVSVFPFQNSQGDFTTDFPSIVLSQSTLPWERSGDASTPQHVPWLAVLVVEAGEDATVTQLAQASELQSPPAKTLCYPDLEPEYGDQLNAPCTVVDLSVDLFNQIAPMYDVNDLGHCDLTYLTHARSLQNVGPTDAAEEYAVIVSNRLPQTNVKTTAYLVSLENMAAFLPDSNYNSRINSSQYDTIRLIVLKQWTFTAVNPDINFTKLLKNTNRTPSTLQFPDLGSITNATAKTFFSKGYTAMNHTLRDGDSTVSWYRGPLIPAKTNATVFNDSKTIPYSSADALLYYYADQGLFDVSYAAAWQLGQFLALQNQKIANALYNWKRQTASAVVSHWQMQILQSNLGETIPLPSGVMSGTDLLHSTLSGLKQVLENRGQSAPQPTKPHLGVQSSHNAVQSAFSHLNETVIQGMTQNDPNLSTVAAWFQDLRLLQGIPFNYLVPDPNMLPEESLRFFYVDLNWIEALTYGAFSIGTSTEGEQQRDPMLLKALTHALADSTPELVTGFLLRSEVVQAFPNLKVEPTGGTLIRKTTLSPSVLFCLFSGEITAVQISEAPEGIHFGFPEETQIPFTKDLIALQAAHGYQPGQKTQFTVTIQDTSFRSTDTRVMKVTAVASAIEQGLTTHGIQGKRFTAAEFGLEMTEGVQAVNFALNHIS